MTEISELVGRVRTRAEELSRQSLSSSTASMMREAAAILSRLDENELTAAILEATGTMGMPRPLALAWAGALARAIINHVTGERS